MRMEETRSTENNRLELPIVDALVYSVTSLLNRLGVVRTASRVRAYPKA